jgi:hypothetical protein
MIDVNKFQDELQENLLIIDKAINRARRDKEINESHLKKQNEALPEHAADYYLKRITLKEYLEERNDINDFLALIKDAELAIEGLGKERSKQKIFSNRLSLMTGKLNTFDERCREIEADPSGRYNDIRKHKLIELAKDIDQYAKEYGFDNDGKLMEEEASSFINSLSKN